MVLVSPWRLVRYQVHLQPCQHNYGGRVGLMIFWLYI